MRRLLTLLTVCVTFTAVAQMATSPLQLPSPITANPTVAASAASNAGGQATPGLLNGYMQDDTYELRVGDTVSFQIMEDQIWNPTNAPVYGLQIQDSGEIEVPYIGRVMAVGKTCKQLAAEIKKSLETDYYKQATVVLSLNSANRNWGRVYIWGQVHNQGGLDIGLNENLTAGQAILRAGGFADFANQSKVKVIRSTTGSDKSKQTQTFNLDMEQILQQGKTDKDIVLQPGDLIIVPSRLINF